MSLLEGGKGTPTQRERIYFSYLLLALKSCFVHLLLITRSVVGCLVLGLALTLLTDILGELGGGGRMWVGCPDRSYSPPPTTLTTSRGEMWVRNVPVSK